MDSQEYPKTIDFDNLGDGDSILLFLDDQTAAELTPDIICRIRAEAVREWADDAEKSISASADAKIKAVQRLMITRARIYADKLERGDNNG